MTSRGSTAQVTSRGSTAQEAAEQRSLVDCLQVNASCSNYDESLAWPLLLDLYVEWRGEQK